MSYKLKNKWTIVALFCSVVQIYAQEQTQEIEKEDVVVEFSFNPTLSDVFKLKTHPISQKNFAKEKVLYNINSKKVASDFTPITQRVSYVNIDQPKFKNYPNYIYGVAGLYGNSELDVFLRPNLIRGYQFGVDFNNENYQNGIKDKRLPNGRWHTNLAIFLGKQSKRKSWNTEIGYDRNQIHWYGLSPLLTDATTYQNKDVKQVYSTFVLSGEVQYKKSLISSITPSIQFFTDSYKTTETNIQIGATLDRTFFDNIKTRLDLQYVNGAFDQNYTNANNIAYSFFNLGVQPSYSYQTEKFKLDMSVGLLLNLDSEASKTNFLFLPKIIGTFPLVKNMMSLDLGIKSEFIQNSYASFAKKNPFVSPTLNIQASNIPVNLFLGLDGNMGRNITYRTEAEYKIIKNQALFLNNGATNLFEESYQLGNTFNVVYDDVNVFHLQGDVNVKISEHLSFGSIAFFNSYTLEVQEKAWNLPNFSFETFANYKRDTWFAQAGFNMVNGRQDQVNNQIKKVDGIFDVNIKGGYVINKKLNAHLNVYNLLNSNYESFTNYQVQGFQAVAGLSYKF